MRHAASQIQYAAESGNLEVLQWAMERQAPCPAPHLVVQTALRHSKLDFLAKFLPSLTKPFVYASLTEEEQKGFKTFVIESLDMNVVEFAQKTFGVSFEIDHVAKVFLGCYSGTKSHNGYWKLLSENLSGPSKAQEMNDALRKVSRGEVMKARFSMTVEALEFFVEELGIKLDVTSLVRFGRLPFFSLKWLVERKPDWINAGMIFDLSLRTGNLRSAKLIHYKHFLGSISKADSFTTFLFNIVPFAIDNGYIHVLDFIKEVLGRRRIDATKFLVSRVGKTPAINGLLWLVDGGYPLESTLYHIGLTMYYDLSFFGFLIDHGVPIPDDFLPKLAKTPVRTGARGGDRFEEMARAALITKVRSALSNKPIEKKA